MQLNLKMTLEDHDRRLTRMEIQYERIVSDVESEKRTRAESNKELSNKLDRVGDHLTAQDRTIIAHDQRSQERFSKQDKILYIGMGVLIASQYFLSLLNK